MAKQQQRNEGAAANQTGAQGGSVIQPAKGKLGVMIPGMGAVATTFVAGVEAVRKGIAKPIGSLTQMGTIRLGKRTEHRSPLIRKFIELAKLEDLVFGGWDIRDENCYQSAVHAGVLQREHLDLVKKELESVRPMRGVFDQYYVKRLKGSHVKKAKTKFELMEQLRADIRAFKQQSG